MKAQTQKVLEYLESHVGITPREAYDNLGIYRLSARIWELRDAGYPITTNRKEVPNRYGETSIVAEYRLGGK